MSLLKVEVGLALLALLVSIIGYFYNKEVAKRYGDLAGVEAAKRYETEKAIERREKILAALHAQLEALPRINAHNQTAANPQAPPKHLLPIPYPIEPFEIAIFSEDGISVSDETIQAATDYLLKARELNVLIEALQGQHLGSLAHGPQPENKAPTQRFIYDQAKGEMPQRIEGLKTCIANEQKI